MAYTIKNITGVPVRIGKKTVKMNGANHIVDDIIEPYEEKTVSKKPDLKDSEKMPNLLIDGKKTVNEQKARVTLTMKPVVVESIATK